MRLSPSKLNKFIDCPFCFWLQENKNLSIKKPFPSITNGMDLVIKDYMNNYRGKTPPFFENKVNGKLIEDLPKSLKCEIDGHTLFGKLDECIINKNNAYMPLDHKTKGFKPKENHKVNKWYRLQMDCYTLLLKKNNYQVNNKAIIVYYYPDKGKLHKGVPFKSSVHKIRTNPKRAKRIFRAAVKCLKDKKPVSSPDCSVCNYVRKRRNR